MKININTMPMHDGDEEDYDGSLEDGLSSKYIVKGFEKKKRYSKKVFENQDDDGDYDDYS